MAPFLTCFWQQVDPLKMSDSEKKDQVQIAQQQSILLITAQTIWLSFNGGTILPVEEISLPQ